jgi:heme A synthase
MLTHLQAMLLFALVVSVAFACLTKRTVADRLRYTLWAFLAFVAVAVVVGWIMYPASR